MESEWYYDTSDSVHFAIVLKYQKVICRDIGSVKCQSIDQDYATGRRQKIRTVMSAFRL